MNKQRQIDHQEQKLNKLTLIFGLLFLAIYFLDDYMLGKLWIFYFLPLIIFGVTFLILFVLSITEKKKYGITVGIVITTTVILFELFSFELFKGKKIFEATLMDDLSAIHLTLRDDNKFEVVSSTLFSDQTFRGDFKFINNKIIFKDQHYDNDFLPDTLIIIGDKVIFRFDSKGNPTTDFATYFDIKRNELTLLDKESNNSQKKNGP